MTKPYRGARPLASKVPPSPKVMAGVYEEYLEAGEPRGLTFKEFVTEIGYANPATEVPGMDDGLLLLQQDEPNLPLLIELPSQVVTGHLEVLVLLVDFEDKPGRTDSQHFESLLFEGNRPGGSMSDFYSEVSLGKVTVSGKVHGWLRLPELYSTYTNRESGMGSYPRNAQKMAEDAVTVAIQQSVPFQKGLDKLGKEYVTALFIVHAGESAEDLPRGISGNEIWSHKWTLTSPIEVGERLRVSTYLTVAENCKLGVCAHELGHLAFQWQDFYDPNYEKDGVWWDGAGAWDLMAGGSWNGEGSVPAHPAGLHKSQHGWVEIETIRVNQGPQHIQIEPYSSTSGRVIRLVSPRFEPGQYLLLESRKKRAFDRELPGEGLLVWRVDEGAEQDSSKAPGLSLIQADERLDLDNPRDSNQGDPGDPFPGASNVTVLSDSGVISTSFPESEPSGITLANIAVDPNAVISLDVTFG